MISGLGFGSGLRWFQNLEFCVDRSRAFERRGFPRSLSGQCLKSVSGQLRESLSGIIVGSLSAIVGHCRSLSDHCRSLSDLKPKVKVLGFRMWDLYEISRFPKPELDFGRSIATFALGTCLCRGLRVCVLIPHTWCAWFRV